MQILNLYAGIGGNRKLWGNEHEITAVEYKPEIAAIYKDLYPNDTVLVEDAHTYLLEHFREYDFIWSSPPCPTHSEVRQITTNIFKENGNIPVFPDMTLYQEIIFLKHHFFKKWVVENVQPYYEPMIHATTLGRHLFWSNFFIGQLNGEVMREKAHEDISGGDTIYGMNIKQYKVKDGRKILRNMVNPELGKHILDWALKEEASLFAHTL